VSSRLPFRPLLLALLAAPGLAHATEAPAAVGPAAAEPPAPAALEAAVAPAPGVTTRVAAEVVAEAAPEPAPEAVPAEARTPGANETQVRARRPYTAASSTTVRERDLRLQVVRRTADLLQSVPGLFTVQHAGGGKANQYFLRGFDADHGTDVALSVDGVPVNMVSHGHGQGYADLNWVIPELVERVEVQKGTYAAEHGDFATAGAVNLVTRRNFESSQLTFAAGQFDTYRGLLVVSPELPGWDPVVAAQAYFTNGPFQNPEGLERYSVFARVHRALSDSASLALTLTSYASGWSASGQLPERAVADGRLSAFGSVDPTEGGASERHALQATFRARTRKEDTLEVMGYLAQSRFNLYSNFTFFSADPENGDGLEQEDARVHFGLDARYRAPRALGPVPVELSAGAQLRSDDVETGLWSARARERLATAVDAHVREGSVGLWAQADAQPLPWVRAVVGGRLDAFSFRVRDALEDLGTQGTRTSGARLASQASPKASVVVGPFADTELYGNWGVGFHSNDARGVVRTVDPVTPLTRATGGEVGLRTRAVPGLTLSATLFRLDLDSELVWVGDEGTTEARGATQRQGVELEAQLKPLSWLQADAEVALSRGAFTDAPADAQAIPLAPQLVLSAGLSAVHPTGLFGRLSALHLGDRPATEDGFLVARGFTRVDATAGWRGTTFGTGWEVSVGVQNLLNATWREAQFANVSRLPDELGADACPATTRPAVDGGSFGGCEDVHFTPGAPFNAQAAVSLFF
jgi:outer membrane receptor protein involved in Fe transport